jgi:hypothetical protein
VYSDWLFHVILSKLLYGLSPHVAIRCVGLVFNNFVSFSLLLFSISPSTYSTANLVIIPN